MTCCRVGRRRTSRFWPDAARASDRRWHAPDAKHPPSQTRCFARMHLARMLALQPGPPSGRLLRASSWPLPLLTQKQRARHASGFSFALAVLQAVGRVGRRLIRSSSGERPVLARNMLIAEPDRVERRLPPEPAEQEVKSYPRRSACHTPEHDPSEPWPSQVPFPPPVRVRRPVPSARWPAPETETRTLPFENTCPCRSTGPPPS